MCPSSCTIACQMLAAIAWLVTGECDKNCFCMNWPSVKSTTVYLNYLSSNKCSVPLYSRAVQQFGGQTTLFWQATTHQLWAAQLLHWEMLNTLVTIAMQQVRIYKCTVGSLSMGLNYYVGQQQNVILLISCCGHRLAQEARHKQSIWSRDCLFFHITQTVGTRNQCNSEHGLIQYASSAFSNAPACFPALCAWQTWLQQIGNSLITVVVVTLKELLAFWRRWKQMYGYKCKGERDVVV